MCKRSAVTIFALPLVVGVMMQVSCSSPMMTKDKAHQANRVFTYNEASLQKAKP